MIARPVREVRGTHFDVQLTQDGAGRWKVSLLTASEGSAAAPALREIAGATCAEVRDAAAVAIALAIEQRQPAPAAPEAPTSGQPLASDAHSRGSASEASSSLEASDSRRRATERKASTTLEAATELGAVIDVGALPDPAVGVQIEISGKVSFVRAIAVGALFPTQTTRLADESGGEFQLAVAGMLLCGERPSARLRTLGCAGFELGRLSAEGFGVTTPRSGAALWQALRADAGLAVSIARGFELMLRTGVAVPVGRSDFVLDGTSRVHRPSNLTVRLSLVGGAVF